MGLEDIGDKVRKRDKKQRAEDLGLDNIDQLEDIEEIRQRLNDISQAHVSQDGRIEKIEAEIETLWKVVKLLLEKHEGGNETSEHMGVGNSGEHKEETGASEGGPSFSGSDEGSGGERDYGWLTDDE